jgi:deazaflavin-dependent oxidoreductase (nitroreductase family)
MTTENGGEERDFHAGVIEEFRASGGTNSGFFAEFNMLLLHTLGAKTGAPRINPMAYQPSDDGTELFIFASNNGLPRNSAWYHNALAHPQAVSAEVGTEHYPVRVREVTGAERDAVYRRQAERHENFADYERRTDRVIPVLGLTRIA